MIDPDLQKQLETINANLVGIKDNKVPGIWRAFFNGIFSALGYFVGLAIVLLIGGWILNKIGVLPEVQKQAKSFQSMLDQAKNLLNTNQNPNGQGSIPTGETTITLPDGRQVKVNR